MPSDRRIYLPPQYALNYKVGRNPVQQLRRPAVVGTADVQDGASGHLVTHSGGKRTLVVRKTVAPPAGVDEVLVVAEGSVPVDAEDLRRRGGRPRWLKPGLDPLGDTSADHEDLCRAVPASWAGQFTFREEQREDGEVVTEGLRPPQIGAVHATLGHWRVATAPATVVMPTGTGKTETMLALLVAERLQRLLVVVPTNALREQVAGKFLTLGVLKRAGVVGAEAMYPVVGTLEHRLNTPDEVDDYFRRCNVVVTNMHVVSGCSEEAQQRMADLCTHLFIDEAHHISAPTWERFRRFFLSKTILQFTATPFRGDGRHVDGKVIFNYPLRKAQEEDYFRPIEFVAVREYNPRSADGVIAEAALERLERDLGQGLNHILMARASKIERATEIHALYQRLAPDHNPLLIHSKLPDAARREALARLRGGASCVVVCVDMLGEGFDLPELKVAALHDTHKSLAITLQFTGRFTRTRNDIGGATVVANIADVDVEESIRALYAHDPDWNVLFRDLSEGATGRQVRKSEFLDGFAELPPEIPLQNVLPKMSTVVYRTRCAEWRPERIRTVVREDRFYAGPAVNRGQRVMVFVTQEHEPIQWGDIKGIQDTVYDLYLVHWNADRSLLFIHSSNNDSLHESMAKAVGGSDAELIRGEQVYRALHGIQRLILMNLGLSHTVSRTVRFTMHVGGDIGEGLTQAHLEGKKKSNIFGRGYENGDRASVGCSHRGRIWSYRIAEDISEWVEWCHHIGVKLLDNHISADNILQHVIIPRQITERPALVPLAIEWPEEFLRRDEDAVRLEIGGETAHLYDVGLELVDHSSHGPIRFQVFMETNSAEYEVRIGATAVEYVPTGRNEVYVRVGRRRKSLSEWLQMEPPIIRFENGAYLDYNQFCVPPGERTPFDSGRIEGWDWTGTNIRRESQTIDKYVDSIQHRVIRELLNDEWEPRYDIVFDDDDAREAADVVAVKVAAERLIVHLFHLKFSGEDHPGARVEDLYAVCGQAQRSVHWKADTQRLFDHLRHREASRLERTGVSRFERGGFERLDEIARQAPYLVPEFKAFVVQPGLSRARATLNQLELLAVTELYLQETYAIGFGVIASG